MLNNFKGYLQTDGYAAYEDFAVAEGITLLHCMAYARRKFHEALDNDEQRANYALEEIKKLYIIERICKENQLNFAELKEMRQQK